MTEYETREFLAAVEQCYPEISRGMNKNERAAMVVLWQSSFASVPYGIMSQALKNYTIGHKWAPKVAEMVDELRKMYYEALDMESMCQFLGNSKKARQWGNLVDALSGYKDRYSIGAITAAGMQKTGNYLQEVYP